jgi:hypothetical protein
MVKGGKGCLVVLTTVIVMIRMSSKLFDQIGRTTKIVFTKSRPDIYHPPPTINSVVCRGLVVISFYLLDHKLLGRIWSLLLPIMIHDS